ncbi:CaiB/BaiF CoA transferase family protein [Mucilaginibacter terrae]|uniref:CaiB/BaiF CoA transferase family protein n=1 Tax=Mucilaginibacter terrae TaxID=1955052 RepID=UPI00364208A1
MKPLLDLLVIDLSQFLSGPSASLRLADLGARVIKIERPVTGDICRSLYVSNLDLNGESSIFHAINRNKESFIADLKQSADYNQVIKLIKMADVLIHNFRPGVMERLKLDYDLIKQINTSIIYAEISGYGVDGPWAGKPGQDLLVQSLSGLTGLNGNSDKGAVPMGISIIDILTGTYLVQGIMASLVQRGITGEGTLVQVSMLEVAADFQFETITTYYRDGGQPTRRTLHNSAHAYLGAPYGVYKTADGFLAIAMASVPELGSLLGCSELQEYQQPASWFHEREKIKSILADHLLSKATQHWLQILEPADIWCAEVLNWQQLVNHEAFKSLEMVQRVQMKDDFSYLTTRCPIKIDGEPYFSSTAAPTLGEHTAQITNELLMTNSL